MNSVVETTMVRSIVEEHGIEEVKKGAELLDEQVPGWADLILLEFFSIADTNQCVLGQIYSDYNYGCVKLEEVDPDFYGPDYGFDVKPDYYGSYGHNGYSKLQHAWEAEIKARQTAPSR